MRTTTIALALALSAAAAADAPRGWRVDNTGSFPEAKPVTSWSTTTNVIWKTKLPAWSNGTPVIVGDRLYVTAEPNQLLCLRLGDGELLFRRSCGDPADGQLPRSHRANGYSSATPATDGRRLFVVYGTGVAAGYDLDGKQLWVERLATPTHQWGHSSSPVLAGGVLVVHIQSELFGLDPETGKVRWKVASRHVWGTPAATRVGATDVVVLSNGSVVRAADGAELASGLGRLVYATPLVVGDVAYFIDTTASAYRLAPDGERGVVATRLWSTELSSRRDRFYASAVLDGERLYGLEQRGTLYVIDAASGKQLSSTRLPLGRGTCYPSLVLAGDVLFAGSDNGTTLALRPGAEPAQLASSALEQTRACAIFSGDRMLVRGYEHLYCIGKGAATAPPPPAELKLKPGRTYY